MTAKQDTFLVGLEATIDALKYTPFSKEVEEKAKDIMNQLPDPTSEKDFDDEQKHRALLIRARAQLLMPVLVEKAEEDLNKALKFGKPDANNWVHLAECQFRRNALRQARNSLDSALKTDPDSVDAKLKLSQLCRCEQNDKDITPEERYKLVETSVTVAKEALAKDMSRGECWSAVGLSLLTQAIMRHGDLAAAKKALGAFNQAESKPHQAGPDPDLYHNRGVVLRMLGEFVKAAADFNKAYELDPKGLVGDKHEAKSSLMMLRKSSKSSLKKFAGLSERDFKKNLIGKLETHKDKFEFVTLNEAKTKKFPPQQPNDPKQRVVSLKVIDFLSSENAQPLVYLGTDRTGNQTMLLSYGVRSTAIAIGDTLLLPIPDHTVSEVAVPQEKVELGENDDPVGETVNTITLVSRLVKVNGNLITLNKYVSPNMAARLFQ